MSDDGFHEIQLSGKQLVFLFMATTVVSVVIFLCGVLVGRGVRARQAPALSAFAGGAGPVGAMAFDEETDDTGTLAIDDADEAVSTAGTIDDAGTLSYFKRLDGEAPVTETLEGLPAPEPAGPAPDPELDQPMLDLPPSEAPPALADLDAAPAAAPVEGFTVQVTALRGRSDAEAIREQLTRKGYPAYVLEPAPDAPAAVFRVRVGRYADRAEAEEIRRRLEQEEQFKPWITR